LIHLKYGLGFRPIHDDFDNMVFLIIL
jgi:hypothetical protein